MATKTKTLYSKASSTPSPPVVGQRCDNMIKDIWGTSNSSVIAVGSGVNRTYAERVITPLDTISNISPSPIVMALEPTSAIATGSGRGYDFNILTANKKYTFGVGFIQTRDNTFYVGAANSGGTGSYTKGGVLAKNTPRYYICKIVPSGQTELYTGESGAYNLSFAKQESLSTLTTTTLTKVRMLLGYTAAEGSERYSSTVGMFFRPFCYEGETWFDFSDLHWKSGAYMYACEVEYDDSTNLITKVGSVMKMSFMAKGKDFISICEPFRSGVGSANFGGSKGKYVMGNDDLYDMFASYPSGFGYAKYASYIEGKMFKNNGNDAIVPSAIGRRPSSYTSVKISITTPGTWYVWRNISDNTIKLANSGGSVTNSYPASSFGLSEVPEILIVRIAGGGGGGGHGNWTNPGNGGGGGGSGVGWVEIPIATTSNYSTAALKCVVGSGGSYGGGAGSPGTASTLSVGSTTYATANGGSGGKAHSSSSGSTSGGTCSFSSGRAFFTRTGGHGGDSWNGNPGGGVSVSAFSISPEVTVPGWSFDGGASPGRGGGGGSSAFGKGGSGGGGGSGSTPGTGYGSGGGGATWVFGSGQNGDRGANGMIMFSY